MVTSQVDYSKLADLFDQSRALSPAKEMQWLDLFQRRLGLRADSRVLDVGCGTGRFAIPIIRRFRCVVVGMDPSSFMLAKAKAVFDGQGEWVQGRVEAIPALSDTFDACLASQVIHHFQDKDRAFAEMYRVLRFGGRLGIRFSSHAQLETILDYRFFPSALDMDLQRLPDIDVVRRLVRAAGFRLIKEQTVHQELFESSEEYLERLRGRYASVLALISEQEYREGLEKAAVYLSETAPKATDASADITFLVGIK